MQEFKNNKVHERRVVNAQFQPPTVGAKKSLPTYLWYEKKYI